MDSYEIVREHFQDRQKTPIKKVRGADFTSAQTIEQTPEKNPIEDIDAQYLFQHFDEIVKVTFLEESLEPERPIESRLDYDDDGLLSPLIQKPTSMKKKKLSEKKELELTGIELFPISSKPIQMPTEGVFETIKKPLKANESHNILVHKQPYAEQSL